MLSDVAINTQPVVVVRHQLGQHARAFLIEPFEVGVDVFAGATERNNCCVAGRVVVEMERECPDGRCGVQHVRL